PLPPYLPRTADAELDAALPRGGLVLLEGDSASGKSRTAVEAICRNARKLGWQRVLLPRDTAALRELAAHPSALANTVVWLDDLDRYLTTESHDEPLLTALRPAKRAGAVLLATLRTEARDALGSENPKARPVLAGALPVRLARHLDQAERTTAAGFRDDPRIGAALDSAEGFAEYLCAGQAALSRWHAGRAGANEPGAALVSAAVDLRRAGFAEDIPFEWLARLHGVYLSGNFRARGGTDPGGGLVWAATPVHGAGPALRPSGRNHFRPFDYLVDRTILDETAPPVPEPVWQWLLEMRGFSTDQSFRLARAAARAGRREDAMRVWSALAGTGNPHALLALGRAEQARGDEASAEDWYRRAAEAGNSWAMTSLGTLAERRRDTETAERWYRGAGEAGDPKGLINLGGLLAQQGRISEARSAYRRAAGSGDPDGLRKEAVLEILHGDRRRGTALLRQVALSGDPAAVRLMGLLAPTGDAGEQRSEIQALRRLAAETGDTEAALELARNLWNQGDLDAAESWFTRAAESGDSAVAEFGLAVLLEQRGRPEEAEPWYRRAAARGLPEAMLNLGTLLQDRGEAQKAEHWYQRALAAGHLAAEVNLGALHWHLGNFAEGRRWYQRAAARGDELAKRALAGPGAPSP
ncbi:tetratricopeptide repeat protein, partial [Amycolatopsis rhizosphaerae]